MSTQNAFTANLRVAFTAPSDATRSLKRQEQQIQLAKIANAVYDAVSASEEFTLALPSGGQIGMGTSFSDYHASGAVKPQIGNSPAQVVLTGFYLVDPGSLDPPVPERSFLAGGTWFSGARQALQESGPTSTVLAEVKALRTAIDTAMEEYGMPTWATLTWYSLFYKGITFGDRGIHFPR